MNWLSENIGTIVVSAVLLAAVAGIVLKLIRDRKKGKSPCGCQCGCCPMAGKCHAEKKE